jgi:hypothetical protein
VCSNSSSSSSSSGAPPTSAQVAQLLKEIQGFVLADHLVWGLWGINQAAAEGCEEFDYLKYSGLRLNWYYADKEEWLATTTLFSL